MDQFFHNLMEDGWQSVTEIFSNVIFPMLIGSIPLSIVVWLVFYYPLSILIRNFHLRRAEALQAGAQRQRKAAEMSMLQVSKNKDNR